MRRSSASRIHILALVAAATLGACATGVRPGGDEGGERAALSPQEAGDALRELLIAATDRAAERVSRPGVLAADPELRVELPPRFHPIASALRIAGAHRDVEAFVASLNEAAGFAAGPAGRLVIDAARRLEPAAPEELALAGQSAATQWLRGEAEPALIEALRPIVDAMLDRSGAAAAYDRLLQQTAALTPLDLPLFDLEDYVARATLAGLFEEISREERRIRSGESPAPSELTHRWFAGR